MLGVASLQDCMDICFSLPLCKHSFYNAATNDCYSVTDDCLTWTVISGYNIYILNRLNTCNGVE